MLQLGAPVQIAYAVDDAAAAAEKWAEELGAGPFFLSEHIPVSDVIYRGSPAGFDHTSAYGQWGDIMVELVQDHGTGPSVVRERFSTGENGLHHMAFFVDDLDVATAALKQQGFELAMSARAGSTRFHFIDAVRRLGHFIELYEDSDRLVSFYRDVRLASIGWDGTEPVRRAG